ncbi:MAG: hypothetical protein LUD15_08740 [Bacteroides sp.]|nr:hypothetical protein [Bacteroides sp.]
MAIGEVNDEIWIGYDHHVYKVTDTGNELSFAPAISYKILESNNNVHCFLQDRNEVWIGTDRGLYCYDLEKEDHRRYRRDQSDLRSLS